MTSFVVRILQLLLSHQAAYLVLVGQRQMVLGQKTADLRYPSLSRVDWSSVMAPPDDGRVNDFDEAARLANQLLPNLLKRSWNAPPFLKYMLARKAKNPSRYGKRFQLPRIFANRDWKLNNADFLNQLRQFLVGAIAEEYAQLTLLLTRANDKLGDGDKRSSAFYRGVFRGEPSFGPQTYSVGNLLAKTRFEQANKATAADQSRWHPAFARGQ